MRHDPARNELVLKVVYYGPGMAGKTTSLQAIHARVPAERRSDLVHVDTHSERTIHFDFLALEVGMIQGRQVRLELHTVPGQSFYAATRKQILEHADGVVFVADSRREALDENVEAMNEMLANLRLTHPGVAVDRFPVVLQVNKQDLANAVPYQQITLLMNPGNWPAFASVATQGTGVVEACHGLARMLAEQLTNASLPAANAPAPAPSAWLITCHRCQKMMEVSGNRLTGVRTCPACKAPFIILDADKGLTCPPPEPTPAKVMALSPIGSPVITAGTPLGSPVAAATLTPSRQPTILEEALVRRPGSDGTEEPCADLPGWLTVGVIDESPMGRRLRLRDAQSRTISRVLILHDNLALDAAYLEGLAPWCRMTSQVDHLHLLRLTDIKATTRGGRALFAIDAPEHESLRDVLARRRVLAPPHAISIIRQLAQVLGEAAESGLVHGYLRPEVILINASGNVLLDELGVPHPPRWLVKESQAVSAGAEWYLAPEYLTEGQRIDVRSDIFLLGCLLYRMLTGEGMVTGYNGHEALHKLTSGSPRLLRDAQPDISRDLSNLHQKMVTVDRRERIASHGELLKLLDRFGGGAQAQTLHLTRTTTRRPSGQWAGPESQTRSTSAAQATLAPTIATVPPSEGATATRTTARSSRESEAGPPPPSPHRPVPRLPPPPAAKPWPKVKPANGIGTTLLVVAIAVVVAIALIVLLRVLTR